MNETRYRFNTYCYCFECGEHWENDLEAHDCRVDARMSDETLADVLGL